MSIKITNQQPAEIYQPTNILPNIAIDLDAHEYLEAQKDYLKERLIKPLFQPLNQGSDVVMEDVSDPTNPIAFDQDAVTNGIWYAWYSDVIDPTLDSQLTEIYYQSLLHSQDNDWLIEQQQGQEAISKLKLPLPATGINGRMVKYTPKTDVIPFAKNLLAKANDDGAKAEWFAYLTGFLHDLNFDNFALLTVQSSDVWNQIKQTLDAQRQTLNNQNLLHKDKNKLLSDFNKISLDGELSTGIFLPENNSEEAYSFSRIVMNTLASMESLLPDQIYVQPLNSKQLMLPENIIVLNLEEYAHASDNAIIKDWEKLKQAFTIQKKLNMVSTKKLMTAKTVEAATTPSQSYQRKSTDPVARRAQKPFSDKPITSKNQLRLMKSIINKATTMKSTENSYKKIKPSYMRPNRRDPNNINLMGSLKTTKYRPDIHIYIDTSGSISERQYRDAVGSLILLTKQINANLYVTSFSHVISQTTLLKTKEKSMTQIYKDFLTIPKVSGGTDFEHVWNKIDQIDQLNQKTGKSYQLNFIITDFGYGLQRDRKFTRDQPSHKYTYYVPISSDKRTWKSIVHMAKDFSKQMAQAGAAGIRKHMLM